MKYAHQCLVTKVSLIAIGVMLTVPLPAGAAEVVKIGGIGHLVNELVAREMRSNVWLHNFDWRQRAAFPYKKARALTTPLTASVPSLVTPRAITTPPAVPMSSPGTKRGIATPPSVPLPSS